MFTLEQAKYIAKLIREILRDFQHNLPITFDMDEWHTLSPEWDMNIFQEDGQLDVYLYAIINGTPDTLNPIFVEE